MTSIEKHKKQLRAIIGRYGLMGKRVVEFGTEKGISTEVLIGCGCDLSCVDFSFDKFINFNRYRSDGRAEFHQMDAREFVGNHIRNHNAKYDAIFWDITFYEDLGAKAYGTKKAYDYERKELEKVLPILFEELLRPGGVLMVNDFLNQSGQRRAVNAAVKKFADKYRLDFDIYKNRGGIAVFQKVVVQQ